MREWGAEEDSSPLFPDGFLKNYSPAKPKKVTKITSGYDVRGDSGVSSAQLNKLFKGVMAGKGETVIKAGKENGIDPAFIAAIATQESGSSYNSLYARKFNNPFGRLYRDKKSGKWLPMKFDSVDQAIFKTAEHLKLNYIGQKRVTLTSIGNKYCPPKVSKKSKDFNDPRSLNFGWLPGIIRHMNKFQSI